MENSLSNKKPDESIINVNIDNNKEDSQSEISVDDTEGDNKEDIDNESEINSENESDSESFIEEDILNKKNEVDETEVDESEYNKYKGFLQEDVSEYSDDDDSSDDDDTYKKLELSRNLLNETYKNLQSINYIEIEKLSKISRDDNNNIIDEYHKTVPILSKYEKTKILGLRSKQINCGAKTYVNVEDNIIDGFTIAERELREKKIPFIIKRPISNNKFEYWKLEDLEIV